MVYEYFNWEEGLIDDICMLKERCEEFNMMYNTRRYHQILGYRTPMEYLEELRSSKLVKDKVYGI